MQSQAPIHSLRVFRGVFLSCCVAALVTVLLLPAAAQGGGLRTAVVDGKFAHSQRNGALAKARAVGATMVRIDLVWPEVVSVRRAGFRAENPNDPSYNWTRFDATITAAKKANLDPIISIVWAPRWAERASAGRPGTRKPNPIAYGKFAHAAAKRYSGSFVPNGDPDGEPLPAVRHWMAWNEPNRDYFLMPQYAAGRLVSAAHYRAMVSRLSSGVKSVNPRNVVIAGGLAPIGRPGKPAPLAFMRGMLCVSKSLHRSCDMRGNPLRIDVWSHHPYTSGGPTHSAAGDNVSLGGLQKMRRVLRAAVRLGHVRSSAPVGFWVTEFSWDSSPPDPRGLPAWLHARWTSEALYRMWRNGVSVVTWFRIQDDPLRATPYQSGFYRTNGAAKLSLRAFRFPTVAFAERSGVRVWGRTPTTRGGTVVLELKVGSAWRRVGTVRANGSGIFQRTLRTPYRHGAVRARFAREFSLPFSLTPVANRYVNPFGCGGGIRC